MYGKENGVICQRGYKRSLSWRGQCEKNICGGGSARLLNDSLPNALPEPVGAAHRLSLSPSVGDHARSTSRRQSFPPPAYGLRMVDLARLGDSSGDRSRGRGWHHTEPLYLPEQEQGRVLYLVSLACSNSINKSRQ